MTVAPAFVLIYAKSTPQFLVMLFISLFNYVYHPMSLLNFSYNFHLFSFVHKELFKGYYTNCNEFLYFAA